ncbi:MAG TPA: mannonate dehydratase [Chloroflexota bacterium]|nr:mannonate dehydratase [Chloroflexota bacterium]
MKIAFAAPELSEGRLRYAKQLGADGVVLHAGAVGRYDERGKATAEELAAARQTVERFGLQVLVLRLDPHRTRAVLAGSPERDQEIEDIAATIRASGQAGIPTVFYNLTPWRSWETPWGREQGIPRLADGDLRHGSGPGRYYRAEGRGGAVLLTHAHARAVEDSAAASSESTAPIGRVSADEMWERVRYLYERIIPVAEEAGVNVGAHPDDPPEREYRGVEQILNSFAGLRRLTELVPSPRNGLLLCLGTLHEMGRSPEDTMEAIDYFASRGKIFSAHFRNPKGTVPNGYYQEDFLDEGDMNMFEVMRLLHRHGYQGALDPDHAVGIEGDSGGRIGFAWELGYMKALRDVVLAGARV